MALSNGLLIADVMHARLEPRRHLVKHRVYYICFPLQRLLDMACSLFSLERFNIFSFKARDHINEEGDLQKAVRSILGEFEIAEADGEVVLLTMPRMLGYVFNPVSFWFCFDRQSNLRAVLAEVCNTFGEKHCYLCFHDDHRPITSSDVLKARKVFHVSPFLEVKGDYMFRFAYGEQKVGVRIDYFVDGRKILATSLAGERMPLTTRSLLRCFFVYPLVTLKVIAFIHWHALRLFLKGIRFYRKPEPPLEEVSR